MLPCKPGTLLEAGVPVETVEERDCDADGGLLLTVKDEKMGGLVVADCCADETALEVATLDGESVMEGDGNEDVDKDDNSNEESEDVGEKDGAEDTTD